MKPFSLKTSKFGTRKNLSPSEAPFSLIEFTASTTMSAISSIIINFVTFSMPFCNPSAQTPIQSMITIAENMSMSHGEACISLKASAVAAVLEASNEPVAYLKA